MTKHNSERLFTLVMNLSFRYNTLNQIRLTNTTATNIFFKQSKYHNFFLKTCVKYTKRFKETKHHHILEIKFTQYVYMRTHKNI